MKFRCFFCGKALVRPLRRAVWVCRGCAARFVLRKDAGGCVIGMDVQTCGAAHCCRAAKKQSARPALLRG